MECCLGQHSVDHMIDVPLIDVIGTPMTALPPSAQVELILAWAGEARPRVVCLANVHMTVEARLDAEFAAILRRADLVAPDGVPLVWMMRRLGAPEQERVAGFDLLVEVCREAAARGISVFFLGSTPDVLAAIRARLARDFPTLRIAGMEAPPFGPSSGDEERQLIARINQLRPGIVFVAFGCPKQERWMAAHKDQLTAVLIGLGAAFSVYAGVARRAPAWMRAAGLEWSFRLAQEPRRLWRRYLRTNALFIALALRQLARARWDR